jgi:hypothetical protein
VLLLATIFFGLALVWFRRMPKEWDPYNPPWNYAHRRETALVLWILAAGTLGVFLLSVVAPLLLPA